MEWSIFLVFIAIALVVGAFSYRNDTKLHARFWGQKISKKQEFFLNALPIAAIIVAGGILFYGYDTFCRELNAEEKAEIYQLNQDPTYQKCWVWISKDNLLREDYVRYKMCVRETNRWKGIKKE